nr:imidazole glycerol phosphate synthase hisHF, chloroplastic-like [Ipomoea trifida]GMD51367.1 imidazole glycerol phosphate synthase hisHF, chloroplastic-like [Ipomoea batatas]GMD54910.1 imidazole glycerol phosphate synthase hisHF, chloroplastic-like [Ipomoea batatas]
MEAAALAFASASQLGTAGNCSSSSSSSAGSRSIRFMQIKPNRIALKFKPSRSSIRASATGEEDSGLQHASAAAPEGPWKYLKIIPKPLSIKAAVATNHKICSNFLFLYDSLPIFTHAISGLEDWAAMENAFQEFDGLVRSCTWSRNRKNIILMGDAQY